MADALISPVLEQLASYVQQEVKLAVHVRDEVKKLTGTLKVIQGVVEDAERKQVKEKGVKAWLAELKEVVYVADDVLDEWNTKTLISQLNRVGGATNTASSIRKKVLSYLLYPCSCFKHVVVRYDIGQRIKEIREHLDVIAERRNQYGLAVSKNIDEPRPLTSSFIDVPVIRGRDDDKNVIMEKLLGESSSQAVEPVHVISIVGMGGSGKTTLAKLVYKEEKVVTSFEKRIWVCVSEPFDQCRVIKDFIEQTTGHALETSGLEALRQKLSDSVKGKRFLLVLDDVWTKNPDQCRQLVFLLEGGSPGSRILVTTRNEEVAHTMGSSYTHNLGKLSDEEGWSILCGVALKGRETEVEDFEKIGRAIASKCKGLPLAIQTLASLLHQKRKKQEWRDILESELWDLRYVENFLLPSLLLSYYSLSSISKQCFLYCANFQKDSEMEKDCLVKMWMAQGFFGSDETRDLEKLGGYYFDDLAMSSFFQDFEKDSDGSIVSCKMHDLVHDLAQFLSHKGFDFKKIRHLESDNLFAYEIPYQQLFVKLSCLRTLDLRGEIEGIPNEVGNLLHLRYLDLSGTYVSELPETICNLYNLQTLKLNACGRLAKIPEGIGYLCKLRHLEIIRTYELTYLPQGVKALSSLRTLSKFIVGGQNGGCKIGDLALLNKLQGDLKIKGLERVADASEAAQAELKRKRNIRTLTFTYAFLDNNEDEDENEENNARRVMGCVLEKLEPSEYLERLKIKRYQGFQFPSWMQNNALLDNVVHILLEGCIKCQKLPGLGKLASLEILEIIELSSVAHIGNEFYGFSSGNNFGDEKSAFPKLKTLKIASMEQWEEWKLPLSKNTKIMPRLIELMLWNCPKLRELPGLGKLASLEILEIMELSSVAHIGDEFYGFGADNHFGDETSAFPKLKTLKIMSMEQWEDWKLPLSKNTKIMPHLIELSLQVCPNLRALPCLGFNPEIFGDGAGDGVVLFPELEKLSLYGMAGLERLTSPHMSVPKVKVMPNLLHVYVRNCKNLRELPDVAIFESLKTLVLDDLPEWTGQEEGKGELYTITDQKQGGRSLRSVVIYKCPLLNVVPCSLFSPILRKLAILKCPSLVGKQPCLPPLLENLDLRRAGVFNESLHLKDTESYSSLRSLRIRRSDQSSLPKGFNQLKSLQKLELHGCESLDFELKELQQFTMLQHLIIFSCPILSQRFQGEEWRNILPHIPDITIDKKTITSSN